MREMGQGRALQDDALGAERGGMRPEHADHGDLGLSETDQAEQHPQCGDQLGAAQVGDGSKDCLGDVGFLGGNGGAGQPGDACGPLAEPIARSTARQMRIDSEPFGLTLLTVQPGGKGFLTLCAIHVTIVAPRTAGVPGSF
jgi:hypothetical protein